MIRTVTARIAASFAAVLVLTSCRVDSNVTLAVKPNGTGSASSSNPQYAFNVLPLTWTPVAGAVGDLATASVTYPIDGTVTKTGTGA